jgi:uncharacterized protein DUF5666
MKEMRTAVAVAGAVLLMALPALAAPAVAGAPQTSTKTSTSKSSTSTKTKSSTSTHNMKGVVKSIDETSMVVERGSGKNKQNMTFTLDSSTHRGGDIKVGETVNVHYRTDASKLMALNVEPVKAATGATKTAAR